MVVLKRNARNCVVVTPRLVVKFPRDGNLLRAVKEFALSWKAFLRGVGVPVLLLGPFLLRPTVRKLLKHLSAEEVELIAPRIEEAIKRLGDAGIEHRELRHPENHVGIWRGRVVFIDFDRGRLSRRPRDLNKFRAWLEGLRRASGQVPASGSRKSL